jgi:hypothetical protein
MADRNSGPAGFTGIHRYHGLSIISSSIDPRGDAAGVNPVAVPDRSGERVEPEAGMHLEVRNQDGTTIPVWVTEVSETSVKLDANHPLAGKDLVFEINLVEIVENPESSSNGVSPTGG